MSDRAIKNTFIQFGIISIPVKLTTLQEPNPIQFHNLCPNCKGRITYKKWCENCNKEVEHKEMLKGYEASKSNIIILTQEQVKALKEMDNNTGIEIVGFIDANDIDFYLFDKVYNLLPQRDKKGVVNGEKSFCLFREALELSNLQAFGRFVMRDKEYLCVIKAYQKRLFLITLIHPHRISLPERVEKEVSKEELDLALEFISHLKTTFSELHNKGETRDKQLERFHNLIQNKLGIINATTDKEVSKFKDLIEALKVSVEKAKKKGGNNGN